LFFDRFHDVYVRVKDRISYKSKCMPVKYFIDN
jgi:hypothetical protein